MDWNEYQEGTRELLERTSEEWLKEDCFKHIQIMDPDGWDRSNHNYSFKEEKITIEEFEHRCLFSTCSFNKGI